MPNADHRLPRRWSASVVSLTLLAVGAAACDNAGRNAQIDSNAAATTDTIGLRNRIASDATLRIRVVPEAIEALRALADSFAKREAVRVVLGTKADGVALGVNLTDLRVFSWDAQDPDTAMAGAPAFQVQFSTDRMGLAYTDSSRYASTVDSTNWMTVLQRRTVHTGRQSVAELDGQRAAVSLMLAEKAYTDSTPARRRVAFRAPTVITMSIDSLAAQLQRHSIDYAWMTESSARRHGFLFVHLPNTVDLSDTHRAALYASISERMADKGDSDSVLVSGAPLGLVVAANPGAPNAAIAERFVRYLLSADGSRLLRAAHVEPTQHRIVTGSNVPASIAGVVDSVVRGVSADSAGYGVPR